MWYVSTRRRIIVSGVMAFVPFVLSACLNGTVSATLNSGNNKTNGSVTISTTTPLESAINLGTSGLTTVSLGQSMASNIQATTVGYFGTFVASGTGGGSGSTGALITTEVASPAPNFDATQSTFTSTINVSYSGFSGNPVCTVLGAFSADFCTSTGFSFTKSQVFSGGLQIELTTSGATGTSNTISSGVYAVRQISNTTNNSTVSDALAGTPVLYNGAIYFVAFDSNGYARLFNYDGTNVNQPFQMNATANDVNGGSGLVVYNGKLYFSGFPASGTNQKLFSYDGTTYTELSNTDTSASDAITFGPVCNGELYFIAEDPSAFTRIYSYDSTVPAVYQKTSTASPDAPSDLTASGNTLYYSATNTNGATKLMQQACVGPATASSETEISNTTGNLSSNDSVNSITPVGNNIYFVAQNNSAQSKVFQYNGSAVTQISNTAAGSDVPTNLTAYNGNLYFSANNSSGMAKLYVYNGSTVNQISNTTGSATVTDAPGNLYVYNGVLYFTAADSGAHVRLWSLNGSTVTQITQIHASASDGPGNLTGYNGKLYFSANNTNGFTKLFAYDGSTVIQVSDNSGSNSLTDVVQGMMVYGNYLMVYGTATASTSAYKLNRLCDPSTGCTP